MDVGAWVHSEPTLMPLGKATVHFPMGKVAAGCGTHAVRLGGNMLAPRGCVVQFDSHRTFQSDVTSLLRARVLPPVALLEKCTQVLPPLGDGTPREMRCGPLVRATIPRRGRDLIRYLAADALAAHGFPFPPRYRCDYADRGCFAWSTDARFEPAGVGDVMAFFRALREPVFNLDHGAAEPPRQRALPPLTALDVGVALDAARAAVAEARQHGEWPVARVPAPVRAALARVAVATGLDGTPRGAWAFRARTGFPRGGGSAVLRRAPAFDALRRATFDSGPYRRPWLTLTVDVWLRPAALVRRRFPHAAAGLTFCTDRVPLVQVLGALFATATEAAVEPAGLRAVERELAAWDVAEAGARQVRAADALLPALRHHGLAGPVSVGAGVSAAEGVCPEEVPGLEVGLLPFQRHAVAWMRAREAPGRLAEEWVRLSYAAPRTVEISSQAVAASARAAGCLVAHFGERPGVNTAALMVSQLWISARDGAVSLTPPPAACRGGVLAQEVGMGKTVEMLALTQLDARDAGPTLVVCPVSLVGQWAAEAAARTPGLSLAVYHGPRRTRLVPRLRSYDLVLTTYGILVSDKYAMARKAAAQGDAGYVPPLEQLEWRRVCLDEAHVLRTARSKTAAACGALRAACRWCVTGTPMPRCVDDLFALYRFLRAPSASAEHGFTRFHREALPLAKLGRREHFVSLYSPQFLRAARRLILRHDKAQRGPGGAPLLSLPPISHLEVAVTLSDAEEAAYARLARTLRARRRRGNLSSIEFATLVEPLRRFASHPDVDAPAASVGWEPFARAPATAADDAALDADVCAICLQKHDKPCKTPCGHFFCAACLDTHLHVRGAAARCPLCRQPVAQLSVRLLVNTTVVAEVGPPPPLSSSKMARLLEELSAIFADDAAAKVLVFTQYTHAARALIAALGDAGRGPVGTVHGAMTRQARTAALAAFDADPEARLFVLSMRAAAVGLNLVAANHVVLWEPSLNGALARQAVGRAWRLGQRRPVFVHKFYARGTVEEHVHLCGRHQGVYWTPQEVHQILDQV